MNQVCALYDLNSADTSNLMLVLFNKTRLTESLDLLKHWGLLFGILQFGEYVM